MFGQALLVKGALGLTATGIAAAGVTGAIGISPAGAADAAPGADNGHSHAARIHPVLHHVAHGEFTVVTKKGAQTYDVQRGQVLAVDANTLVVTSRDGFRRSYTLTADTKFNLRGDGASAITTGERVVVLAQHGDVVRVAKAKHAAVGDGQATEAPATD